MIFDEKPKKIDFYRKPQKLQKPQKTQKKVKIKLQKTCKKCQKKTSVVGGFSVCKK
jgi:ribosomal protein S14